VLRHLKNLTVRVINPSVRKKTWGNDSWTDAVQQGRILLAQGKKEILTNELWTRKKLAAVLELAKTTPQKITQIGSLDYWVFADKWYTSGKDLEADEVLALLKSSQLRTRQSIERAKSLSSARNDPAEAKRGQIPSGLRLLIWAKYEGTCADCGATSELQFDHIIPVALGGATSEENLQILCGSCNRSKGISIG
jgi:hypothetical protein